MPRSSGRRKRRRGAIDVLPSGALRVRVYAGVDPISKRRIDLSELVPAGPRAEAEAERVRTKLLNQVDEKRNPKTKATVNQLLDRWLKVLDVETSTRRGYLTKINKHIKPILGHLQVGRIDSEILDSFYADLRTCRDHCGGRQYVQHRTTWKHTCDEHDGTACVPSDMECHHCRRACKQHRCRPLSDSSIRSIHWILSSAFQRAVRWGWIALNAADSAEPPRLPSPDPLPPSTEDAALIVDEAFRRDPDWGAFVWTAMTTGPRRGELCALRWSAVDLDSALVTLRRALYVDNDGSLKEKDTKTHQQRRIVLDAETLEVLREHHARSHARAQSLDLLLGPDAYVFSRSPDGSEPLVPASVTQRYDRMVQRLGVETTLHKLRHYSATELLRAGVDIRTIAGRLGHGGGGATTLRVYAAWSSEADQRAARTLTARMPTRAHLRPTQPSPTEVGGDSNTGEARGPYVQIARDLRGAISSGVLRSGDPLPSIKTLAARYDVSVGTAHRAVALLATEGRIQVTRGRRATVR